MPARRKQNRQRRGTNVIYGQNTGRLIRQSTDLMMASGALIVGAGALGLAKGALNH